MTSNQYKDDIETQQLSQEDLNYLQRFEKFLALNSEKINSLDTSIKVLQIISIFAGLLFLIFFTTVLALDRHVLYAYIYSSIPFMVGIISLTLAINFFLNLTVIYNEGMSLASWMSYFSVNLAGINFIIFILLLTLKLEGLINVQWKVITIPLYIIIGISLFYFIFMMPAFINQESYWVIFLLSTLILNSLIFMILINSTLDNSYKLNYVIIFIPIWITSIIFFAYNIYSMVKASDTYEYVNHTLNLIVNMMLLTASILIAFNLDKIYFTSYVISYVLIIFSYLLFFTERLLAQFNISFAEKK